MRNSPQLDIRPRTQLEAAAGSLHTAVQLGGKRWQEWPDIALRALRAAEVALELAAGEEPEGVEDDPVWAMIKCRREELRELQERTADTVDKWGERC